MEMIKIEIAERLVKGLIEEQFPQWADLEVRAVELSGIDNRTFRLGEEMLIRLPSAEGYAGQVEKEQKWLLRLAPYVSVGIPEAIAMGVPSASYPWNWSVYRWIEGVSANVLDVGAFNVEGVAVELARFLKELWAIDVADGPVGGLHNYYRGADLSVYDGDARSYIVKLSDVIDSGRAMEVWEKAVSSKWVNEPVWVHGDFSSGNILIGANRLVAVIDFGCMGVGDPACDLVIAWTFLEGESKDVFREQVGLDDDTWDRARGWALWKACYELTELKDKRGVEAVRQLEVINEVCDRDSPYD